MQLSHEILKERQGWTLDQKIDHTLGAIDQFLSYTNKSAYISYSGGKDSTVLLRLARIIQPDIPAVFCNTGVEFPDILRFVKNTDNCTIIRPKKGFKEVVHDYGFPLISKETSMAISRYRHSQDPKQKHYRLFGEKNKKKGVIPKIYRSFAFVNYECSEKCCYFLKKKPLADYEKKYTRRPIIGTLAEESQLRASEYIKNGCNTFNTKSKSTPLSIWTEADIWSFIERENLPIADIYYKGAIRTGCCGCSFGAHLETQANCRYALLYKLYPKFYHWFMDCENNGVTYRKAIREVFNRHGRGRYLPDEKPLSLF